MTGTSMDAVDAVVAKIDDFGLNMQAQFSSMATTDLGEARPLLRKLASQTGSDREMKLGAKEIGERTLKSINALDLKDIDLIALHGQTIFHKPPTSIQLIDTTSICESFNCTILNDPRQQDLALGGQGAPITPLADWVMFRSKIQSTAIVNLGGFCNITIIPANATPSEVRGFDLCSCNLLLNSIAQQNLQLEYDKDGAIACTGNACDKMVEKVYAKLYSQRTEQRSLGTDDDLSTLISEHQSLPVKDVLASIHVALGNCINKVTETIDRVFLAGGGIHNQALIAQIRNDGTTEKLGVPTQAREGMAMAILGALAQDGVSITIPQITGRKETTELVAWTQEKL